MRKRENTQKGPLKHGIPASEAEAQQAFKFLGEEPEPVFVNARLRAADTTYLEVSPEVLIEVAKHLPIAATDHGKAIEKAYLLICEAHLISRNIQLWNESVGRGHTPENIDQLVANADVDEEGRPLREPLLVAFFKARGGSGDATNASKQFNEWLRQKVRLASFSRSIPYSSHSPGWEPELYQKLIANGWIVWGYISNQGYLKLPLRTVPERLIARKIPDGEHPTKAYWTTTDVWWPEATKAEIAEAKGEFLTSSKEAFRSQHAARKALAKFAVWLDIESKLSSPIQPKATPRNRGGTFVSKKHKGAGRGEDGRFGKT